MLLFSMQGVWKESTASEFHWQPHNDSPLWRLAGDNWHLRVSVNSARLCQQWQVGRWRSPLSLCQGQFCSAASLESLLSQRSLLNCFRTGQGHYVACKKKWKLSDSDQCSCGETQMMSHIVESCPQTRLHGGLSKLHSADDDAAAWLSSYGS